MKCPMCGGATRVNDKRDTFNDTMTWRRRECTTCHHRFTTHETIVTQTGLSLLDFTDSQIKELIIHLLHSLPSRDKE